MLTAPDSQSPCFQTELRINLDIGRLFWVRSIADAFHVAKSIDPRTGYPSEDALNAYRWLMKDPPSRYITPINSFAWCCLAGFGADWNEVRERGLRRGQYLWKESIGGINAV